MECVLFALAQRRKLRAKFVAHSKNCIGGLLYVNLTPEFIIFFTLFSFFQIVSITAFLVLYHMKFSRPFQILCGTKAIHKQTNEHPALLCQSNKQG